MLLIIATVFAIIYALLTPMGEGLMDTSKWIAKVLSPEDTEEIAKHLPIKQMMLVKQAAYMDGWLSNIPFFSTIAMVTSIVIGFFFKWWGGFLMLIVAIILGMIAKRFMSKPLSHYLVFIHHKMIHRAADYKKQNDTTRHEVAEEANRDLAELLALYGGTTIRPPTEKELKQIPYGDKYFWLSQTN